LTVKLSTSRIQVRGVTAEPTGLISPVAMFLLCTGKGQKFFQYLYFFPLQSFIFTFLCTLISFFDVFQYWPNCLLHRYIHLLVSNLNSDVFLSSLVLSIPIISLNHCTFFLLTASTNFEFYGFL
jgi:hypothetical protein